MVRVFGIKSSLDDSWGNVGMLPIVIIFLYFFCLLFLFTNSLSVKLALGDVYEDGPTMEHEQAVSLFVYDAYCGIKLERGSVASTCSA